jgi:hypothetical protein
MGDVRGRRTWLVQVGFGGWEDKGKSKISVVSFAFGSPYSVMEVLECFST